MVKRLMFSDRFMQISHNTRFMQISHKTINTKRRDHGRGNSCRSHEFPLLGGLCAPNPHGKHSQLYLQRYMCFLLASIVSYGAYVLHLCGQLLRRPHGFAPCGDLLGEGMFIIFMIANRIEGEVLKKICSEFLQRWIDTPRQ